MARLRVAVLVSALVLANWSPASAATDRRGEVIRTTTVGGPVRPGPGARTIPFFVGSFTDDGTSYSYVMAHGIVTVNLVPLRVRFDGGEVFDGSAGAADIVASPIFTPATFDTGTTQYVDAMRRAEFGLHSSHGLTLQPRVMATRTVAVPAGAGYSGTSFFGARAGYVSHSWLDSQIRSLQQKLVTDPANLTLFVTKDLLLVDARGCCVGGYHGVRTAAGHGAGAQAVWTYALANWYTPGGFLFSDTTVASHELAEWADDPFESNSVSPWISPLPISRAVYGCYRYLENADPTLDVDFSIDGGEHHLQDVTFWQWFAREQPSSAFEGRYTYTGAFSDPAPRC